MSDTVKKALNQALLLICLLALFSLFACSSDSAGITATEDGGIAGTTVVTNNLTRQIAQQRQTSGSSVENFRVFLFQQTDSILTLLDSTFTDEEGKFFFNNLDAGTYSVLVNGQGSNGQDSLGGRYKDIQVEPGIIVQIQVNITMVIIQNIENNTFNNFQIVNFYYPELGQENSSDLIAFQGDSNLVSIKYLSESGDTLTGDFLITTDSEGKLKLIPLSDRESDSTFANNLNNSDSDTTNTNSQTPDTTLTEIPENALAYWTAVGNINNSAALIDLVQQLPASIYEGTFIDSTLILTGDSARIRFNDSLLPERNLSRGSLKISFILDSVDAQAGLALLGDEGARMTLIYRNDSLIWLKNNDDLTQRLIAETPLSTGIPLEITLSWGTGMEISLNGSKVAENNLSTGWEYSSRSLTMPEFFDENILYFGYWPENRNMQAYIGSPKPFHGKFISLAILTE